MFAEMSIVSPDLSDICCLEKVAGAERCFHIYQEGRKKGREGRRVPEALSALWITPALPSNSDPTPMTWYNNRDATQSKCLCAHLAAGQGERWREMKRGRER